MREPKAAKRDLRRDLRERRAALTRDDLARSGEALAAHVLALPELAGAGLVTAYVSVGSEPVTGPLLEALRERGFRVMLPVTLPDLDLDWAMYDGPGSLAAAGFGLLEPTTPRLGPDAVALADVLLVPGTAVSADGVRLGQGGGCYDRALARVAEDRPVVVLLHEHEVGVDVPREEHDRLVDVAVTPAGVTRLG